MACSYRASLEDFLKHSAHEVIGQLSEAVSKSGFVLRPEQTDAWETEIALLKDAVQHIVDDEAAATAWALILEYEIPRRSRWIDGVLLVNGAVLVLEFKVGATTFDIAGVWQVQDYALDLRDFHLLSRGHTIFPVLIATKAAHGAPLPPQDPTKLVAPVERACPRELASVVSNK